jgi:uncharacterized protein
VAAKQKKLESIVSNYLTKDILAYDGIKKPDVLMKLLKLLALQVGSEVSYLELAQQLQMSTITVQKYIDLLEKTFVVFTLRSYHTNTRKELSKSKKIYFWDVGMRNAILEEYRDMDARNDCGALRENFCIAEKYKHTIYHDTHEKLYFRRTLAQQEVDLLSVKNATIHAYEMKYSTAHKKITKAFSASYPDATAVVISPDTIGGLLGGR